MEIPQNIVEMNTMKVLPGMFVATCGMDLPSAFIALGACAGFASQMAVWKELVIPQSRNPGDFLVKVEDKDKKIYYLGDAINHFLFQTVPDRMSFLSLASGAIKSPERVPDIADIARYKVTSIGTPAFGHPRLPEGMKVLEPSFDALLRTWKNVQTQLETHAHPPREWPYILGLVAWSLILGPKTEMSPATAVRLMLEAALPMSAIDPTLVPDAGFVPPASETWSVRALDPKNFAVVSEEITRAMPTEITPEK